MDDCRAEIYKAYLELALLKHNNLRELLLRNINYEIKRQEL